MANLSRIKRDKMIAFLKEMIELQNAIEVDNVKNVIVLNKVDFKNTVLNPDVYS